MLPGRNEPYLKRVRDVDFEVATIAGRADSGMLTEGQMTARILAHMAGLPETSSSWSARDVEAATTATMQLLGEKPAQRVAATSSRRGDVLTYLAGVFSLVRNAAVLTLPEDREYFFPQSEAKETTPYLAAAFLIKWGFLPAQEVDRLDMNAAMPREELYALLASWLHKHEASREITGKVVRVDGRNIA